MINAIGHAHNEGEHDTWIPLVSTLISSLFGYPFITSASQKLSSQSLEPVTSVINRCVSPSIILARCCKTEGETELAAVSLHAVEDHRSVNWVLFVVRNPQSLSTLHVT